ncbi:MAG: 4Fe-4S dicluster domain-containing protein [Candidatus Cloacimonadota bacterium]|nr:4Fe-4S dicluster domain-containing protein [Candidatus Cloacimonadota bacterium]
MAENQEMVTVFIMGEPQEVPASSTIVMAYEYAGFQLKKGVGCREGFCGACATIYREKGDYKLKGGLGCQTVVKEGMSLAQIPYVPAEKPLYEMEEITPDISTIKDLFPTVFRCVACNTCSKACPQDIEVMDYIQAAKQGDIAKVAEISFDCIRCGLCALRCPAEIVQFNVATIAQRMYGKYLAKKSPELKERVQEIENGKFDDDMKEVKSLKHDDLVKRYYDREINIT